MQVRLVRPTDQDQLYDKFMSAQVRSSDINPQKVPSSGFFEYDLDYNAVRERAQDSLSLVLQNPQGRILAYIIGYDINHAKNRISNPDAVHKKLESKEGTSVYLDQLFLEKGMPLHLAMRVFDKWDFLVRSEGAPQVFTAVPHRPWRNVSSERLVAYRGFKRHGFVEEDKLSLGLFEKPFY